jgi:hypothetical protein
MTDTLPHLAEVERNAERVVVWSPPSVTIRGVSDLDESAAGRAETLLCALSSVLSAARLSSHVIGASPQSTILAQSWKGSRPTSSLVASIGR